MIHRIIVTAMLLASTPAAYPAEPDEQTKIDALKLGYALNDNSMVRWGSIDLTSLLNPLSPFPRPVPKPIEPYGPPRPLTLEPDQ